MLHVIGNNDSFISCVTDDVQILMNASALECVNRRVEIPGDHSSVCVMKDIAWHQMDARVTVSRQTPFNNRADEAVVK